MDSNYNFNVLKREKSESSEIEGKCRQILGSLMYVMLGTRPDICAVVSILSRYQSCASHELLQGLKRVMRYLQGTKSLKLIYQTRNRDAESVKGYVDADWGRDEGDRRSMSGFCFFVFDNIISWSSKKQNTVALSTAEAELVALSAAISQGCLLRNMFFEMFNIKTKVVLFEDNQAAIRICNTMEQPKRIKHLDIKHYFVKEKVEQQLVEIRYVKTNEQLADILTKPLSKGALVNLRDIMLG